MPRSSTAGTRGASGMGCASVMRWRACVRAPPSARTYERGRSGGGRDDGAGWRALVDVDSEQAGLDLLLLGLDLVEQVRWDPARDVFVDLGQRCATLGIHAEVLEVLGRVRAR